MIHSTVQKDLDKLRQKLNQDIRKLKETFLSPDLMGGRPELLEELAAKLTQIKALDIVNIENS